MGHEEVAVLQDRLDFIHTTYSFVPRRVQADIKVKRVSEWLLGMNSRCRVDTRNINWVDPANTPENNEDLYETSTILSVSDFPRFV